MWMICCALAALCTGKNYGPHTIYDMFSISVSCICMKIFLDNWIVFHAYTVHNIYV